MIKIIAISDTHNQLSKVNIPDGDVLIHAGDGTMMGRPAEVAELFNDLEKLKDRFDNIIFIAGNHDFMPETDPHGFRALVPLGITYLEDTGIEIDGVKFWGTPWVHNLPAWAFNEDDVEKRKEIFGKIPDDTDVLISHGPPYGILDRLARPRLGEDPNVGCKILEEEVQNRLTARYHIFGHIHESRGHIKIGETEFINASILDERYKIRNKPIVFEIEKE